MTAWPAESTAPPTIRLWPTAVSRRPPRLRETAVEAGALLAERLPREVPRLTGEAEGAVPPATSGAWPEKPAEA
jgi:hypothetical protein